MAFSIGNPKKREQIVTNTAAVLSAIKLAAIEALGNDDGELTGDDKLNYGTIIASSSIVIGTLQGIQNGNIKVGQPQISEGLSDCLLALTQLTEMPIIKFGPEATEAGQESAASPNMIEVISAVIEGVNASGISLEGHGFGRNLDSQRRIGY